MHHDAAFASVSYLRLVRVRLVEKEQGGPATVSAHLTPPPLLDPLGRAALQAIERVPLAEYTAPLEARAPWQASGHVSLRQPWLVLANLRPSNPAAPLDEQVHDLFSRLEATMQAYGYKCTDIAHINVYLASQADFAATNAVYRTYFGAAPPSRACIAVPAGQGPRVCLDIIACREPNGTSERRVLHVQSRSYWAPANIGPYSQAVGVHGRIYMAGQIGMDPCTLQVPDTPSLQLALALQHQRRVALAVREWNTRGVIEGGVCWLAVPPDPSWTTAVAQAWTASLEPDTQLSDPAHPHAQSIPDDAWLGNDPTQVPLLCVFLGQDALPKQAIAEWQLTASLPLDDVASSHTWRGRFVQHGVACTYRVLAHDARSCGIALFTRTDAPDQVDEDAQRMKTQMASRVHAQLLYDASLGPDAALAALTPWVTDAACVPTWGWAWPGEQVQRALCALVWT